MPQLYGAPRYTRPPQHREAQRPFDPDDLPLEAHRGLSDQDLLGEHSSAIPVEDHGEDSGERSFLRRAILPFGLRSNRPSRSGF